MVIKLDGLDHAPALARIFVTQMLTPNPDLFAVANVLVHSILC